MDVPQDAHCIPRVLQPELGVVPRLGDGDTAGENPPACALNLEAINKEYPTLRGTKCCPCTLAKLGAPKPHHGPQISQRLCLCCREPPMSPTCSIPVGIKATGRWGGGRGARRKGMVLGRELAQPFPWPQDQHQATSLLHLSLPSPSSPRRPLCHPHLRSRCCSPYL